MASFRYPMNYWFKQQLCSEIWYPPEHHETNSRSTGNERSNCCARPDSPALFGRPQAVFPPPWWERRRYLVAYSSNRESVASSASRWRARTLASRQYHFCYQIRTRIVYLFSWHAQRICESFYTYSKLFSAELRPNDRGNWDGRRSNSLLCQSIHTSEQIMNWAWHQILIQSSQNPDPICSCFSYCTGGGKHGARIRWPTKDQRPSMAHAGWSEAQAATEYRGEWIRSRFWNYR